MKELERIRRLRGLSQKDVADKAHVAEGTVAGIEAGRHTPRASTARKLAAALAVEVADLYGEAIPKGAAPSQVGPSAEKPDLSNVFSINQFEIEKALEKLPPDYDVEHFVDYAMKEYERLVRQALEEQRGKSA